MVVASRCPSPDGAGSTCRPRRRWSMPARVRADDELRRARADLRLAFAQLVAAQVRERELTAARDRLRGLADVLAKREAAGDAAGFDRLRAEREVLDIDADRAAAATDRARARRPSRASSPWIRSTPRVSSRRQASRTSARCPPVDALVERAESTRGELLALRKEKRCGALGGTRGRSAVDSRAGDRGRHEVVDGGRRRSRQRRHGARVIPLFDRGHAERALARGQSRPGGSRADVFRAPSARRSRRFARPLSNGARRPNAIGPRP